jgi:triphosphatase
VARDIFRDCFAQIAANMALVAGSDEPEGPHQLRVGLRRLRAAFLVFRDSLGAEALQPLSEEARRLGQVVGGLRDLDVLTGEVVADAADLGLDEEAHKALVAALEARRRAVRTRVRRELAAPEAVGFLFDLGRLIEGRGWLVPSDYGQSARLATPIGEIAAEMLDARLAKAEKRGRSIRRLDAEGLHALRKELKKLRYAAEMLAPLFSSKRVGGYLKALKSLQDAFGSLNDAAMAATCLTGPRAPAANAPAAQRAVGWVLGALAVRGAVDVPRVFEGWEALARAKPFWR